MRRAETYCERHTHDSGRKVVAGTLSGLEYMKLTALWKFLFTRSVADALQQVVIVENIRQLSKQFMGVITSVPGEIV